MLLEVLGESPWQFSYGARGAVLRAAAVLTGIWAALAMALWAVGLGPLFAVLFSPLSVLGMPVNPQGRGEYHIAAGAGQPAA